MVHRSWSFNKNKISHGVTDIEDDVWKVTRMMWELAAHNPCVLEGMALDVDSLEGVLEDSEGLEGGVGVEC